MMRLEALVETSETVRSTSRKKEKISLISGLLRRARGREISLAACFLSGQVPQGRLGIGWRIIEEVSRDLRPAVDPSLELTEVDRFLEDVAAEKGQGSLHRKKRLLGELLSRAAARERGFLVGLILGEIRQGALEGLVVEAVASASGLKADGVRQALMFSGDIGEVARAALWEGAAGLGRFGPELFRPISPMLANPAEGEDEALSRLGEAGWEYKIDGARIQLHKRAEEVRIFTRHLKEVTASLPEIVALATALPMERAIFEGEAVALQPNGKPSRFQITMRRFGRIQDVKRMQEEIPLTPYFFDLLYLDGESLSQRPYGERFGMLLERVPSEHMIRRIVTGDAERARDFLARSLQAGHEGLVAKGLDSPYMAGQRGFHWLKIKPARTLDLVVLAAEWGHGRRKGWLSNLHLGARDPQGGFVMLGKTFKGLTDDMLRWLTERLQTLETGRDDYTVHVRPELVVEVAFSDLQESPRYPGGLALRFARVKRFRQDKPPAEADTIQTARAIFEAGRSS
jgi:DNA ligase-1